MTHAPASTGRRAVAPPEPAFAHPPGSPFRADYQPQVDWSDIAVNLSRANTPAEGRPGWGKGTIPGGLSARSDPGKAGRLRKPSGLG